MKELEAVVAKLEALETDARAFMDKNAVGEKVIAIEGGLKETKEIVADIMKRFEDKRVGLDGVDKVLAIIPEDDRKYCRHAELYSKSVRSAGMFNILKDPITAAACAVWLQKVCLMDMYPAKAGEYKAQLEKMGAVLGNTYSKVALQEDTDAEGGYLVPTPLEAQILDLIEDFGLIRPLATKVPMTSKEHKFPSLDTNFTVTIEPEEDTIADSGPVDPFGQKALIAKKFCGLVTTSIELVQDNAVGLMLFVQRHLGEKISRLEDTEALEGDGTYFTGLSDDTSVNEIAATGANGDEPSFDTFSQMKWKARERSTRLGAGYIIAPEIAGKTERLKDDNNRPIWTQPFPLAAVPQVQGPMIDGYLLGYPVYSHSGLSIIRAKGTSTSLSNMYFGPYDAIILGDRTGISFGVSEHVNWAKAQLSLRVIKRTGIMIAKPTAFTRAIDIETA